MDQNKPSIPLDELSLRPASDWKPVVADAPLADLAKSDNLVALGRQRHSETCRDDLCANDLPNGPSVVVYCGNAQEVSRGFLIALRAMGIAAVEQLPEPAKPPVARAKP
jgi:hypothetical protein